MKKLAITIFFLQALTGVLLLCYYQPGADTAYESVQRISEQVPSGWMVRGLHIWGAHAIVLFALFHMLKVFFYGEYKHEGKKSWKWEVVFLFLILTAAFSGYVLAWTQASYWGTTVGTEMLREIPLVGESLLRLVRGGDTVNGNTLGRFFALHIIVVPLLIVVVAKVHRFRLELKEWIPVLLVFGILASLAVLFPQELGAKANPLESAGNAKPEWYFLPLYQLLRFLSSGMALWASLLIVAVVFFLGDIDRCSRRTFAERKWHILFGLLFVGFLIWLGWMGHLAHD